MNVISILEDYISIASGSLQLLYIINITLTNFYKFYIDQYPLTKSSNIGTQFILKASLIILICLAFDGLALTPLTLLPKEYIAMKSHFSIEPIKRTLSKNSLVPT